MSLSRGAFAALLVGLLGGGSPLAAQTTVYNQLWLDYNPQIALGAGHDLSGQIGWRTPLDEGEWSRWVLRAHVSERDGGFDWSAGAGMFYTRAEQAADLYEIRPFQGLRTKWPDGRFFRLDHYLRVEERLQWTSAGSGTDFSVRLRYRLQTEWAVSGFRDEASWRLILNAEAFGTMSSDRTPFGESSRLGVGIERGFPSAVRVRLDVIWQRAKGLFDRTFEQSSLDAIYFRLRLFQRFGS
jgi:hypothetical protein